MKIYVAKNDNGNSGTDAAFRTKEEALRKAEAWMAHLSAAELKRTCIMVECHEINPDEIEENVDANNVEAVWAAALAEDVGQNDSNISEQTILNDIQYKEDNTMDNNNSVLSMRRATAEELYENDAPFFGMVDGISLPVWNYNKTYVICANARGEFLAGRKYKNCISIGSKPSATYDTYQELANAIDDGYVKIR